MKIAEYRSACLADERRSALSNRAHSRDYERSDLIRTADYNPTKQRDRYSGERFERVISDREFDKNRYDRNDNEPSVSRRGATTRARVDGRSYYCAHVRV